MNDSFQTEETEENGKKKKEKLNLNLNLFPIIIVFVIIIVVIILAVVITNVISNNKKKNKAKEENNNIVNLNSELDGAYGFAKEGNRIVVLRDKKTPKTIYNISQGTGNYGEFLDYTYYDKKLYLLFNDSIESISLTDGNGIYELKKEYDYEQVKCNDGTIGKTTNLIVTDDIVYFNNSSCAISGFNRNLEEDETKEDNQTTGSQVNIYQFNTLKSSSMTYSDGVLYFTGDNKLFKVSEEDGDIKEIANNISSNYPLFVQDGVLIYSNKNNDKTYNFFGISTDTFESAEIVKNAKGLSIYDQTYYYYDNNGVYKYDGENSENIYSLRYNELSSLEIYNGLLQIVDKSTNGDEKKRINNIDLKNKNKTSVSEHEYTMIRNIEE